MSDLISRQAAIYAIVNTVSKVDDNKTLKDKYDGAVFRQHEILDIIENMPPAQQWIPVSERLPEKEGYYLLTVKSLIAEAGSIVISRPYNGRGGFCDVYWNSVVAWMPKPEPFKEGWES